MQGRSFEVEYKRMRSPADWDHSPDDRADLAGRIIKARDTLACKISSRNRRQANRRILYTPGTLFRGNSNIFQLIASLVPAFHGRSRVAAGLIGPAYNRSCRKSQQQRRQGLPTETAMPSRSPRTESRQRLKMTQLIPHRRFPRSSAAHFGGLEHQTHAGVCCLSPYYGASSGSFTDRTIWTIHITLYQPEF